VKRPLCGKSSPWPLLGCQKRKKAPICPFPVKTRSPCIPTFFDFLFLQNKLVALPVLAVWMPCYILKPFLFEVQMGVLPRPVTQKFAWRRLLTGIKHLDAFLYFKALFIF
jgi:hypothetical protein